jgi:hypothetical protein
MAGANRCWHEKDRVSPDQAVLDEALREGLNAIRTAAAERDESASAGSDRADPQDHEGSAGRRIPTAHQEGSWIQALGQAAAEAEAVSESMILVHGIYEQHNESNGREEVFVLSRSACCHFAGLFRVGGFVVPRNVLVRLNDVTVFPFQKYPYPLPNGTCSLL